MTHPEAAESTIPAALAATLSVPALAVLSAIYALADLNHGLPRFRGDGRPHQRYVSILSVRKVTGLPAHDFDQAMGELAGRYLVWLRTPAETSAEQDAASYRHHGNDRHEVTGDDWRSRQQLDEAAARGV